MKKAILASLIAGLFAVTSVYAEDAAPAAAAGEHTADHAAAEKADHAAAEHGKKGKKHGAAHKKHGKKHAEGAAE